MKRILAMTTVAVFMFGMATLGFAEELKCLKCHKGDRTIDKMVARANIVTDADLKKALKEGPKSGFHKIVTEDDINEAATVLNLKKIQ